MPLFNLYTMFPGRKIGKSLIQFAPKAYICRGTINSTTVFVVSKNLHLIFILLVLMVNLICYNT